MGPVNTVAFHCVSDGESPLHLVTEAGALGYTTTFDTPGRFIDTTVADALITCRDVGPPVPTPVPPPNDDFANATSAPRLPFSDSVNTASATREPAEPKVCAQMGSATVWYRFTPDVTQFVQADTLGSDFDTVIGLYTGATLASLTPVACKDDADGLQSKVVAELEGGRTYYFEVGGFSGYRGSLVFNLGTTPAPPPPLPNALAVDAVSGGGIESTRTVTGIDPFQVDINVTAASQPYQGYQYVLQWDPAILAYDSQANLTPAELTLCATVTVHDNTLAAGCVRTSGPTQFVGPVNTVSLHCVADGTGALHLRSLAEGYPLVTKTAGPSGAEIDNFLTDAYVTCQGTGRKAAPSPMPTPLPVPPLTGTGGFLKEP